MSNSLFTFSLFIKTGLRQVHLTFLSDRDFSTGRSGEDADLMESK
jgi:hypothetical protein